MQRRAGNGPGFRDALFTGRPSAFPLPLAWRETAPQALTGAERIYLTAANDDRERARRLGQHLRPLGAALAPFTFRAGVVELPPDGAGLRLEYAPQDHGPTSYRFTHDDLVERPAIEVLRPFINRERARARAAQRELLVVERLRFARGGSDASSLRAGGQPLPDFAALGARGRDARDDLLELQRRLAILDAMQAVSISRLTAEPATDDGFVSGRFEGSTVGADARESRPDGTAGSELIVANLPARELAGSELEPARVYLPELVVWQVPEALYARLAGASDIPEQFAPFADRLRRELVSTLVPARPLRDPGDVSTTTADWPEHRDLAYRLELKLRAFARFEERGWSGTRRRDDWRGETSTTSITERPTTLPAPFLRSLEFDRPTTRIFHTTGRQDLGRATTFGILVVGSLASGRDVGAFEIRYESSPGVDPGVTQVSPVTWSLEVLRVP